MSDPAQNNQRLVSRLRSSLNPVVQQAFMVQDDTQNTADAQQPVVTDTTTQVQAVQSVQTPIEPSPQSQPQPQPNGITQDDALDVLEQAMAEVEAEKAPVEAVTPQDPGLVQPAAAEQPPAQSQPPAQPPAQSQPPAQPPVQSQPPAQPPVQSQPPAQPQPPVQQQPPAQPLAPQQPPTSLDPGVISQAIPQAVEQAAHQELNPPQSGVSGAKESLATSNPDTAVVDAGQAIQYVEQEPSPEIPPEVESYLQKVENHADQAPDEIVIADGTMVAPKEHNYPSQPVVVVPITPEVEKKGRHKNPKFSVRWLVEWSHKVMKKFVGKVIYREVPEKRE